MKITVLFLILLSFSISFGVGGNTGKAQWF